MNADQGKADKHNETKCALCVNGRSTVREAEIKSGRQKGRERTN